MKAGEQLTQEAAIRLSSDVIRQAGDDPNQGRLAVSITPVLRPVLSPSSRQLDILESVGVKPENVVIGHACCLDDQTAEVIKQIAKRGAFVGFDRVTGGLVPDDKKVTTILALLDAGYADKLLICSDFTGRRTLARPGYGNTLTVFVPLLRKAGVKEDVVRGIVYDNPRRFLAYVPTKA